MNTFIDIYCERLGPGLMAEPLNAITNLSFFIAAFFAYRLTQKQNALNWRSALLIVFLIAIGTGSTLFHTLAVHWAMMSDVLPILFYQITFIAVYAQRVMNLKCTVSSLVLAGFFALTYMFEQIPSHIMNGSLSYGPAFLFLTGLGFYHLKYAAREKWGLLLAAAIFITSITFRSIDMALCETFPIGTHFLWHTLNGVVLYLTTRAYILNARRD